VSRKLLAFLLSELKTVRILCKKEGCRGIIEVSIEDLPGKLDGCQCPFCKTSFRLANEDNFALLAKAIGNLARISDKVDVEFILPDNATTP
jgi:hypothetical protein